MNIRVVDVNSISNITFVKALFRFIIKTILGLISLFWALFTNKQQSLHDLITKSAVIYAENCTEDLMANGLPDRPFSPPQEGYILPSRVRRVFITLLWSLVSFIILVICINFIFPEECIDGNTTSLCMPYQVGFDLVFIITIIFIFIFGAKGRLLGARKIILLKDESSH